MELVVKNHAAFRYRDRVMGGEVDVEEARACVERAIGPAATDDLFKRDNDESVKLHRDGVTYCLKRQDGCMYVVTCFKDNAFSKRFQRTSESFGGRSVRKYRKRKRELEERCS